jgi:hypothetical protein
MRWKTLILYYNFFVNSSCYYGLSMNIGDLGGDVFLNFSISGQCPTSQVAPRPRVSPRLPRLNCYE